MTQWRKGLLTLVCLASSQQRLARELHQRRGSKTDPAWAHSLSPRGRDRLHKVLATDDPTGELDAAWGVKEALRLILASPTIEQARAATITAWWPAIETTITTSVTNTRTEAANTTIKHIKRTGRGYRNRTHYQARILLHSAHRAQQHHLTSQGTTVKCE